jgi:hypothetical protein
MFLCSKDGTCVCHVLMFCIKLSFSVAFIVGKDICLVCVMCLKLDGSFVYIENG